MIPGSHLERTLHDHDRNDNRGLILNQDLSAAKRGPTAPRSSILEPGQFSLHDVYLIQRATPNTSGRRPGALAFRFMASGTDVSGKNDIVKPPTYVGTELT